MNHQRNHSPKLHALLLYDGTTGGAYNAGRYLSAAILSPTAGGTIILPKAGATISEQQLTEGLSDEWSRGYCFRGKHGELYAEQSPCVSHAHASLDDLLSAAEALLRKNNLPEALIKETATDKVIKIKLVDD